jgi:hypothetical protein
VAPEADAEVVEAVEPEPEAVRRGCLVGTRLLTTSMTATICLFLFKMGTHSMLLMRTPPCTSGSNKARGSVSASCLRLSDWRCLATQPANPLPRAMVASGGSGLVEAVHTK